MINFFQTEAARIAIRHAQLNHRFYQNLVRLIQSNASEEDALTIFDLEDMIMALPEASPELAVAVSELASNAGREYISAHELHRRGQELTSRIFKVAYLGFLIANGKVTAKDLFSQKKADIDPDDD